MRAALRRLAHPGRDVITPGARWSVTVLALLMLGLTAACLLFTVHYVGVTRGQIQRQAAREQAAQQRQGAIVERRLCTTLDRLTALAPPPGSAAANPSRAYEQQLHAVLAELGPDVGCR